MKHPYFFGYGSLVNRRTHDYDPAHRATARGWRRAWRYTEGRQVAYLTAIADPESEIEGLIAPVPGDDWHALDLREAAYDRLDASSHVAHEAPDARSVAVYAIAPERLRLPDDDHPVLLSYIDVVVQGYLSEFGAAGAERFFATTTGWEVPVLNDRHAPRYPRSQTLSGLERDFVDAALTRLGCRVFA
ncbi:gamma-glutamylcyclotransferase family protein [Aestuariicoccus sp. MJ-SS9]|uniref:gamma-glutamylcyclotransferase family protein n=1 Tax=Aestuariicoccus sp. MJ-SS9 TaxID=3079855 RepID=UPI00290BDC6C|nr:gamma-glutamylcyclotransferase family protein [Aestuariicoccus sp. MJ-SS9]MDU8909931.1 gamma-glutamylcyclotransferase family protein [Aestuariicoccus sp. MJ-SS9]